MARRPRRQASGLLVQTPLSTCGTKKATSSSEVATLESRVKKKTVYLLHQLPLGVVGDERELERNLRVGVAVVVVFVVEARSH